MEYIIIGAFLLMFSLIMGGFYQILKGTKKSEKKMRKMVKFNLLAVLPALFFFVVIFVPGFASAAQEQGASNASGLGYIAAALSTGLASLGAGFAVSNVGSSAIGAVSEDPKILGKSMIFLGLSEGIAIYGLIISIMILGQL